MSEPKPLHLDRQQVLISDPIYTEYDLTSISDEEYARFMIGNGAVDAFCLSCEKPSVFRIEGAGYGFDEKAKDIAKFGVITIKGKCSRSNDSLHSGCDAEIHICFYRNWNTLTKIGQYPSKADLDFHSLDPVFSKELDQPLRRELGRAIGLRAHGVGIGSFVYLRRIFESLVEEAYKTAAGSQNWDEEKEASFQKCRMLEKISMLKDWLPRRLVKYVALYGVLSKGIHELTEAECNQTFELIKNAILMILRQRHEEREQEKILRDLSAHAANGRNT